MLSRHSVKIFAAAGTLVIGLAGSAKADCQAFPDVPWWNNLTHDRVTSYVNRKHDGEWADYVDKWENQLEKLEGIASRGNAVVVGKDKQRLEDEGLLDYIELVKERVEVNRCLAEAAASSLANFSTAAGGDGGEQAKSSLNEKLTSGSLEMEVSANCKGRTARIQLVNKGASWPQSSTIFLHNLDGDSLVARRRLRLKTDQSASFKVKSPRDGIVTMGLRVEPSWTDDTLRSDLSLSCK